MMMSLFSIFDPFSNSILLSNWIMMCLFCFMWYKNYYFLKNFYVIFYYSTINFLFNEIKILMKKYFFFSFFISLFMVIFFFNFLGLLPYVFPITSHMTISFSLSIPLWMMLFLFSIMNFNELMTHLVPLGCPSMLMPFMVLIESISLIIRPLTLAVRLSANIIAGHMILILISLSSFNSFFSFFISLFMEMMISILEIGVAIIQPYVFFILMSLYSLD